jgi:hypothetical protein
VVPSTARGRTRTPTKGGHHARSNRQNGVLRSRFRVGDRCNCVGTRRHRALPRAGGPLPDTAPVTKPIFYFGNSHLVQELNAGSISQSQAQASSSGITFITCFVNFNHSRYNTSATSYFNWAAGVGCNGTLQMWGRAYLVQVGYLLRSTRSP